MIKIGLGLPFRSISQGIRWEYQVDMLFSSKNGGIRGIIRWDYHLEATAEALSGTISNDIGIKWDYQVGLPFEKHFLIGLIVLD